MLVVTCAIREGAEQRVWTRLEDLAALKKRVRSERHLQIGVLGCMAGPLWEQDRRKASPLPRARLHFSQRAARPSLERLKTKLLERQKLVDIIAGPDAYRDLPRLLMDSQDGQAQVSPVRACF